MTHSTLYKRPFLDYALAYKISGPRNRSESKIGNYCSFFVNNFPTY